MKIEIPELALIQKELAAIKVKLQELDTKDKFIPKKVFMNDFQVSSTACANYEREGYLIPYKLKGRIFYKESQIRETLECGVVIK